MTTERNDGDAHRIIPSGSSPTRIAAIDVLVLMLLAVSGWGLWAWAASLTDAEAWDHESYWSVVLPAMALLSGAAGWLRPRAARLVGVALVVPQAIALFTTSESSPLAVVGLVFFIMFAMFFTSIALVAARFRNWVN